MTIGHCRSANDDLNQIVPVRRQAYDAARKAGTLMQVKGTAPPILFRGGMAKPFTFKCPVTRFTVQSYDEEDGPPPDGRTRYKMIECLACRGLHLVDPQTGGLMADG